MRICLVTNTLTGGGAEKQLWLIARGLAAAGWECGIYVLSLSRKDGRHATVLAACRDAGVAVHVAGNAFGLAGVVGRLALTIVPGRDRAVIWTWGYRAEALRLAVPALWLARGFFSLRSASRGQFYRWRWLLRLGRPLTRGYVSNSHLAVTLAEGVARGIGRKAHVVHNALEPSFLAAPDPPAARPERLDVLMLGNVRFRIKGYDTALVVAAMIKAAGLPMRIRIGGAQPGGEPVLAAMIQEANLQEVIEWVGSVADPMAFLRTGHAFLLLSRYEGMPNALFEAMALGLPCLATDVGDLRLFEAEMNGLRVIPIDDAAAVVRELKSMWEHWDAAVAMGRRGRAFCRANFSEEAMLASVLRALGGGPAAGAVNA